MVYWPDVSWLDIWQVLFLAYLEDSEEVEVHKHTRKERGNIQPNWNMLGRSTNCYMETED